MCALILFSQVLLFLKSHFSTTPESKTAARMFPFFGLKELHLTASALQYRVIDGFELLAFKSQMSIFPSCDPEAIRCGATVLKLIELTARWWPVNVFFIRAPLSRL